MKKAILFFIIGSAVAYAAARMQLDIYVLLSGVCLAAGSITYGYLLLVKRQYDRMILEGDCHTPDRTSSTRPAA